MILFEGIDRCGKTTAAMVARRELVGWSYRHHTKLPEDMLVAYHMWGIADAHPRMLIDRLHLSDYAYGNAYRGKTAYTFDKWRRIELALMSRGTVLVYMYDDLDNIRSRWGADEMFDIEGLERLEKYYENVIYDKTHRMTTKLSTVTCRMQDLICEDGQTPTAYYIDLLRTAEENAHHAAHLLPATIGYGSQSPKFVVVGEQPGEAFKGELEPGFPLDRGKASEWLWRAFDDIKLRWWDGYYTNANAFESPAHFAAYMTKVLCPDLIVGLGKPAEKLIRGSMINGHLDPAISCSFDNHPGYEQRFKHGDLDKYATRLQDVLKEYCECTP